MGVWEGDTAEGEDARDGNSCNAINDNQRCTNTANSTIDGYQRCRAIDGSRCHARSEMSGTTRWGYQRRNAIGDNEQVHKVGGYQQIHTKRVVTSKLTR